MPQTLEAFKVQKSSRPLRQVDVDAARGMRTPMVCTQSFVTGNVRVAAGDVIDFADPANEPIHRHSAQFFADLAEFAATAKKGA